jgi:hypothetical protein
MSTFYINMTLTNLQGEMAANLRRIAMMKPEGELGEMVRDSVLELQRYQVSITHVGRYRQAKSGNYYYSHNGGIGGGALRASSRVDVQGAVGRIYISPDAVNPLTHSKPSEYGVWEEKRGGSHAFFARTVAEQWPKTARDKGDRFLVRVVKG